MATVEQFKSQLKNGGARPNQFRVTLTFPDGIVGSAAAAQKAQFLIKATSLPASTVEDIAVGYRGRTIHFAGERNFADWDVTIINDTGFEIRKALENWHHKICNYDATNGEVAPLAYQVDLTVEQLDRNDEVLYSYIFKDAYPTTIAAIELAYETNTALEEYGVTFTYNFYEPSGVL